MTSVRCRARVVPFACDRLHFLRLVFPWTDVSLGNCSYLDTCRHMKTCRYVHYQLDDSEQAPAPGDLAVGKAPKQAVPKYLEVGNFGAEGSLIVCNLASQKPLGLAMSSSHGGQ